jgi:hypothetical protein
MTIVAKLRGAGCSDREISILVLSGAGFTNEEIDGLVAGGEPLAPPTEPPGALCDDVGLAEIQFMDPPDAGTWPIVTDLKVHFEAHLIRVAHSADWTRTADVSGKQLAGNFWIGIWNGHRWQMCPYEWFRPGQDWCARHPPWHEGHLCPGMARGPHSGEEVLYMVSTCARVGVRTTNERSRIVKIVYP